MTARRFLWLPVLALGLGLAACATATTEPNAPTMGETAGGTAAVTSPTADLAGAPTLAPNPAAAQTAAEAFVAGGPRYVAAKAVDEAVKSGQYPILFVDARTPNDYEFGHIPGAVNVPYFEADQHAASMPKDKWLVAYCECPHAEADQVADAFEKSGLTMVRVIDEGLQGWKLIGGETVAGTAAPVP
jgi:cytochrome c oxidase cbb3-type subunit 3/ubiquinol-cytochrome c reductase cytochrome c subunit